MKYLACVFSLIFVLACTKNTSKTTSKKANIESNKMTRSDVNKMKKKMTFVPVTGDISPEGFNWVHYDFAVFFSGAFYEHNLKGKYRDSILKKRLPSLEKYLYSLSMVKKSVFDKWESKHRDSFLINTYHASLIRLMAKKDFKDLDKEIYKIKDSVNVFGKQISLEQFINTQMVNKVSDYKIAFTLKCFEKNCPEFRNTIYNFKNVMNLIKVSSIRYFIDPDMKYVFNSKVKFPYIQSLFLPMMPKTQKKFKQELDLLLRPVKNGKDQISLIKISIDMPTR